MSVNDPTIELGDPTTVLNVEAVAAAGQADVVVDKLDGLQAGDAVAAVSGIIGAGVTISSINTGTKTLTLSANLTGAGLAEGASLTLTRGSR